MAKIERKYLAHYINAGTMEKEEFQRLGKDLEEYSPSMSASVETKKNILGESAILISGYEKTGTVETYYAEEGSLLFAKLQEIIDEGKVLDDLKTSVVDVKLWEECEENTYSAVCEEAYIEITSYGGDTSGYQIPFTLHYTGNRKKGTFNIAIKVFQASEA